MRSTGAATAAQLAAATALFATLLATPARSQGRLVILDEPAGTAVGLAVVINAGNAWETAAESGLGRLAAQAVVERARPRLAALGATASVACDATTVRFSLVLPAPTWQSAAELFFETLFEYPVGADAVARARAAVLEPVRMEEHSFTGDIRAALARARFGRSSRWARPPCGRAETLAALGADDVERMIRTRFLPTRATAAIVGPVDTAAAGALLRRWLSDSDLPVLVPAPDPTSGGHIRVERATVTTWVALAFPFDRDADIEALRLLGFRIREAVGPSPARPEIFDAAVELERHGDGGALIVYLVTAPDRARDAADTVRELIHRSAAERMPAAEFDALLQRYRGHRLLALAAPEARAMDAALELFFDGAFHPAAERVADLTRSRLRHAADALGTPASAVLGPPPGARGGTRTPPGADG
ncbi:MAG TPA: insulinase family protein [Longimicrobiales bacterium]